MSVFDELIASEFHAVVSDEFKNFVANRSGLYVGFDAFERIESRRGGLVYVSVCF